MRPTSAAAAFGLAAALAALGLGLGLGRRAAPQLVRAEAEGQPRCGAAASRNIFYHQVHDVWVWVCRCKQQARRASTCWPRSSFSCHVISPAVIFASLPESSHDGLKSFALKIFPTAPQITDCFAARRCSLPRSQRTRARGCSRGG
eukprot:SAG11_NODE_3395_length_2473_cov_1.835720_1_plen_146_part_00